MWYIIYLKDVVDTTFSEDFKFLFGKRFLFKVKVPHNNAVDEYSTYTVVSTTDEISVIEKWVGLYIKIDVITTSTPILPIKLNESLVRYLLILIFVICIFYF